MTCTAASAADYAFAGTGLSGLVSESATVAGSWHDRSAEATVRVDVSAQAAEFVREQGGQLWVWAAYWEGCAYVL
jgi:hypothetical protein